METTAPKSRRSIRLRGFDYSRAGAYFITICVAGNRSLFGRVIETGIELSAAGRVVDECWSGIPAHFPSVQLDEFVVMPNHFHAVVWLGRGTACRAQTVESFAQPTAGSLPTLVRSFKSAVTRQWREAIGQPGATLWQRNYFERVIRDADELLATRIYIRENPRRWSEDEYYTS